MQKQEALEKAARADNDMARMRALDGKVVIYDWRGLIEKTALLVVFQEE